MQITNGYYIGDVATNLQNQINQLKNKIDEVQEAEENHISDYTKSLLGLPSTAGPDDAFQALLVGTDAKAYRVTVTYPNGQPAVGFTVGGIEALPTTSLTTDANGMVLGKSSSTYPTITVAKKYDDIDAFSGSFASAGTITDCRITLSWSSAPVENTVSGSISPNVSKYATGFEYLIVGGGGSGGAGAYRYTGSGWDQRSGGGGGDAGMYEKGLYNLPIGGDLNSLLITVVVGSGGYGLDHATGSANNFMGDGAQGNSGGSSSISIVQSSQTTLLKTVSGGAGGNGGRLVDGSPDDYGRYTTYVNGGAASITGVRGRNGGSVRFTEDDNVLSYTNAESSSPVPAPDPDSINFGSKNYLIGGGGGGGAGAAINVKTLNVGATSSGYGGGGGGNAVGNVGKAKDGFCAILYTH